MLAFNVFGTTMNFSVAEAFAFGVACARTQLFTWYKHHKHLGLTEICELTVKMMGSPNKRRLKTKALETYGVFLFLLAHLERSVNQIPEGELLLEAGYLLQRFIMEVRSLDYQPTLSSVQDCFVVGALSICLHADRKRKGRLTT